MLYLIMIQVVILLIALIIIYYLYNKNQEISKELKKSNIFDANKNIGFFENIIEPVKDLYIKFNFILYFFVSILFYALASIKYGKVHILQNYVIESPTIQNIFTSIATVILSSGVFSSITKSRHFLNIFSNEIKKIVYTEKFISKQKNIDEIWNIVTKSVCNENFYKISDRLFDSIKNNYLPINQNYYYQNFELELFIKFDENGTDYVIIEEKTKVDLICENTKEIKYHFVSNIDYEEHNESLTQFEAIEFKVNNEDMLPQLIKNIEYSDGCLKADLSCALSGKMIYSISRIEKKKYPLKLNSNRVHSAAKIYNNFQLAVYYPKNLKVRFAKLGFNNNWEKVEVTKISEDIQYLKTRHEGIFFQNQGYMLNFLEI